MFKNLSVLSSTRTLALACVLLFSTAFSLYAQDTPTDMKTTGNFLLVIENWTDGRIYAVNRFGQDELTDLGKVLAPVASLNPNGFTASGWGQKGAVIATAVNAIHVKVGQNPDTSKGKVFSVLPIEFAEFDPTDYLSYFNEQASLFTDIHAGENIFGGGFAPRVGDLLFISPSLDSPDDRRNLIRASPAVEFGLSNSDRTFHSWTPGLPPIVGDIIAIEVKKSSKKNFRYIEFNNKFGGLITGIDATTGEAIDIGQVYQPVFGVGRFEGSVYAASGRIRANHPGVICVSTSPIGELGGFQIIPLEHAMSPEMKFARTLTQWMVVGPIDPRTSAIWEGLAPLFYEALYPSYIGVSDERFDDMSVFLNRFNVDVMMKGDTNYRPMPTLIGKQDEALMDLVKIRIYFPIED